MRILSDRAAYIGLTTAMPSAPLSGLVTIVVHPEKRPCFTAGKTRLPAKVGSCDLLGVN